jgi:hypothetical protein
MYWGGGVEDCGKEGYQLICDGGTRNLHEREVEWEVGEVERGIIGEREKERRGGEVLMRGRGRDGRIRTSLGSTAFVRVEQSRAMLILVRC